MAREATRDGPTPARQLQRDERRAQTVMLSFTGDDGLLLAELAGEALAGQVGHALRPGWRPVHTRGVLMEGRFITSGQAGDSAPAHLQPDQDLKVIARFSSCDASLDADDRRLTPRGLAVRFFLPDGRSTDLLGMNADRFPVTTRDAFVSASKAMRRGRLRGVPRLVGLGIMRQFTYRPSFPPTSYAYCSFYALHTFKWTNGKDRLVRYQWRPTERARRIWPWTVLRNKFRRDPTYLRRDLQDREKPVSFHLEVLDVDGVELDRLADIRRRLRRRVRRKLPRQIVGTLNLHRVLEGDEETNDNQYLFSPAHLIDGIEPLPEDQIMAARTAAYPASHVYRLGKS